MSISPSKLIFNLVGKPKCVEGATTDIYRLLGKLNPDKKTLPTIKVIKLTKPWKEQLKYETTDNTKFIINKCGLITCKELTDINRYIRHNIHDTHPYAFLVLPIFSRRMFFHEKDLEPLYKCSQINQIWATLGEESYKLDDLRIYVS